jgi:cysteine-rich repeat protein
VAADAAARHLPPGTYYVRVEEFGNNNQIAAYSVHVSFNALCGNGVKEGSEECDGGPTCDANCDRIPICGDFFIDAPETCEDGNTVSGDGCSDMCYVEDLVAEVEPNNTIAAADLAPILISGDAHVKAIIGPALGDKDVYKVVLAQASIVRFETFDGSLFDCTGGITTTLRLYNSTGMQLYSDDTTGINACSALVVSLPAGTYYVQVEETGNNALIPSYILEVDVQSDAGTETEPNDTQPLSNSFTSQLSDFYIFGDHSLGTDLDYYAINVPPGWSIRAEAIEGDASETCESTGIDTFMTLYNGAGTQLVADDDTGRGFCSLIDGTGSAPLDPGAHGLAAGVYYLRIAASSSNMGNPAGVFKYRLVFTMRSP